MRRPAVLPCFTFAFLALSACDDTPPPIVLDAGPRIDAGRRDAGPRPDAGPPRDAGPLDAGDSGPVPMPDGGGAVHCTVDPAHVHELGADPFGGDRIVGLAAGATSFAVVWTQVPEGQSIQQVVGRRIESSGELAGSGPVTITPGRSGRKQWPVVAATGSSWVVAWIDNSSDAFEVYTQGLATDLAPTGTAMPVTATPARMEDNAVLLDRSGGLMLAWVEDMTAGTRVARAQPLATDGTPTGGIATASNAEDRPGQIAIGELADGPVLVWSEGMGGRSTVYMQGLTSAGAVRGPRVRVSADAEENSDGTVDAALAPSGGAIVFGALVSGIRPEVRFRAIGPEGELLGDERVLAHGNGASVARFAGGFAVAYRAPASGETPAQIRLMLVSALGDVVAEVPVVDAPTEGGRTTVRVSGDGRIGIAWAEPSDAGTAIGAAVVTCGVGS
ncbi:MAG TPA: hypothetical protein VIL20_21405 [Sandaracinaceae bacterium]